MFQLLIGFPFTPHDVYMILEKLKREKRDKKIRIKPSQNRENLRKIKITPFHCFKNPPKGRILHLSFILSLLLLFYFVMYFSTFLFCAFVLRWVKLFNVEIYNVLECHVGSFTSLFSCQFHLTIFAYWISFLHIVYFTGVKFYLPAQTTHVSVKKRS